MASESKQMVEPNKLAIPGPTGYLLLREIGSKVRDNFMGCKCPETKCKNAKCPCWLELYRCTLKCECVECDNMFGVRGSDSNIEPGQGGTGLFDLNKLPSSNIEPKQAETSSMAGESTQIAEPNKMAAPSPAGYLLLREIGSKVREDFMGCKCPETKCKNVNCPCCLVIYNATWRVVFPPPIGATGGSGFWVWPA